MSNDEVKNPEDNLPQELEKELGPRINSYRTASAFYVLSDGQWHDAAEIALYTGEKSRFVYPRLKIYIGRFIEVVKFNNRNGYKLKDDVKQAIKRVLKLKSRIGNLLVYIKKAFKSINIELSEVELKIMEELFKLYKITKKLWFEHNSYSDLVVDLSEILHEKTMVVENALNNLVHHNILIAYPKPRNYRKIRIAESILQKLIDIPYDPI